MQGRPHANILHISANWVKTIHHDTRGTFFKAGDTLRYTCDQELW